MSNGTYDIIIIGSGAGGGTLARHLAPSGKSILLLERGDWLKREPENWSAEEELTTITASVAGGLIAFYQIGYGIAAFGVGPLQSRAGLELNTIYGGTAIFALVMFALSFVVIRQAAAAPCGQG